MILNDVGIIPSPRVSQHRLESIIASALTTGLICGSRIPHTDELTGDQYGGRYVAGFTV